MAGRKSYPLGLRHYRQWWTRLLLRFRKRLGNRGPGLRLVSLLSETRHMCRRCPRQQWVVRLGVNLFPRHPQPCLTGEAFLPGPEYIYEDISIMCQPTGGGKRLCRS